MSGKQKKKARDGKLTEDQLFENIYVQETGLPKELEGKLHIISCLTFGEECQVYLTEDETGRRYILKRAEGSQKQLLLKEAESLRRYHYSFLPEFISWTETIGSVWLQREYIPGDTLWELTERTGPFEPGRAGVLMCRLCEMVSQLHDAEPPIIHRDLKPQNIVLTPEENLFLIDLGTVREYREDAEYDTVFVGTRLTAAPEQYGFHQTDCRTDIYALGVIYLYLLTGSMELQKPELWSPVSPECRRIIEKCTSFNPQDRYQNCRELKAAIVDIIDRSYDRTYRKETDGRKLSRRWGRAGRRRLLVMGAACLIALAGSLWYVRMRYGPYTFQSELIGQAVRLQLGKEEDEAVSRAELAKIETLRICGSRILEESDDHMQNCGHHYINDEENETRGTVSDISDCVWMKNLHTLVLDGQQITDITPLKDLPVENLSLCDNPVADLMPLASAEKLKVLSVEETEISDLTPLSELSSLTWLDIGSTDVTDLKPLESMGIETLKMASLYPRDSEVLQSLPLKKLLLHSASGAQEEIIGEIVTLEELTIYNYRHLTLEPLLNLTDLTLLDLYGGELNSLEGSGQFRKLSILVVGETQVSDLSPIKDNSGLTQLGLEYSPVTDFSVLKQMTWFRWLGCSRSQKEALDRQIPNASFQIKVYEDDPLVQ